MLVRLIAFVTVLLLVSCAARSRAQEEAAHIAATELSTALSVGVTYSDFREKLQRLSSTVKLAAENGLEKDKLSPYKRALECYQDTLDLWSDKIKNPRNYTTSETLGELPHKLNELMAKYRVQVEPTYTTEAPFDYIDQKTRDALLKENPELRYQKHYNIERTFDVVLQHIWARAGAELKGTA